MLEYPSPPKGHGSTMRRRQYRQGEVKLSSVEKSPQSNEALQPLLPAGEETTKKQQQQQAPALAGLLFFRTLYFLDGLSASTWGRFGIIFYNQVAHLSPAQIGIVQGVVLLPAFISTPLWGLAADWWQSRKLVYLCTHVWRSAALVSLAFLPHDFHWIVIAVSTMSIFQTPGVLDAHLLDFLGDAHRGLYGTVRLWSALAWGFGAMIMGWVTDMFGFHWNFVLYGLMAIVMFLVIAFGLPNRSKTEQERYDHAITTASSNNNKDSDSNNNHNHEKETLKKPQLRVLLKAIFRLPVLLWLLELMIISTGVALVEGFLFVYLQNDLNASTRLCGATVGVTVLTELPIFQNSKALLEKAGHDALFVTAMLCYASRVYGYTLLTESTVHWILALEALHGVTFACTWIAAIDYAAAATPKEWSTTIQSILSGLFYGFGSVLGGIFGGWVMENYSAKVMYRGMGGIMTITFIVHLIVRLGFGKGHDSFLEHQHRGEEGLIGSVQTVINGIGTRESLINTTESDEEAASGGERQQAPSVHQYEEGRDNSC